MVGMLFEEPAKVKMRLQNSYSEQSLNYLIRSELASVWLQAVGDSESTPQLFSLSFV